MPLHFGNLFAFYGAYLYFYVPLTPSEATIITGCVGMMVFVMILTGVQWRRFYQKTQK